MKRKRKIPEIMTESIDSLEISLVGSARKSSVIIRQIKNILVFKPDTIRFSVYGGEVELNGSALNCSVFWNHSFRITGHITRIDILEKK